MDSASRSGRQRSTRPGGLFAWTLIVFSFTGAGVYDDLPLVCLICIVCLRMYSKAVLEHEGGSEEAAVLHHPSRRRLRLHKPSQQRACGHSE